MKQRLTQKLIDALQFTGAPGAQCAVWDTEIPGFGVRVWPSGEKTFAVRYTFAGRRRYLTLGPYGILTLSQARDLARIRLAEALQGSDPLERKRQEARGVTVADLAREYLERHARPKKANWRDDEQKLTDYVLPAIGRLRVDSVTQADISRLIHRISTHDVAAAKTRKFHGRRKLGGPICANRTLALLSGMFNRAKELVGIDAGGTANPTAGIEKHAEHPRDRYVTPAELPKLRLAIEAHPDPFVRAIIWLYLLTGFRKSELRLLKWEDVDFALGQIRLPDTKAGRTHYLPLSEPARRILGALPRFEDNVYVFCGRHRGKPLNSVNLHWNRIRKEAGLEDVWVHDLRATLGSLMAQHGVGLALIGKVLNHSKADTTKRYARFQLDPVAKVVEEHGQRLLTIAQAEAQPAEPSAPPTSPATSGG